MYNSRFEKKAFKKEVEHNVKSLYRRTIDEATPQQLFQAVSYAVKEAIIDDWIATQEQYKKDDPKTVYYMSMEFLMGRALGNNLINMTAYKEVKEALDEMGIDLNVIEDEEPDAALGNGGLGRLAACFLDSLATLGYAAYGCGIRYKYGMFKQKIRDGYQVETPDNWLKDGNPFEVRRDEYAKEVTVITKTIINVIFSFGEGIKSTPKFFYSISHKKPSEKSETFPRVIFFDEGILFLRKTTKNPKEELV